LALAGQAAQGPMQSFADGDAAEQGGWSGEASGWGGQSDDATPTASSVADREEWQQQPLTPLDAALIAEGQRLDDRRDRVLAEIALLGDELVRLAQRRGSVDALLANGPAKDSALSA
jgi:hypothetical protein